MSIYIDFLKTSHISTHLNVDLYSRQSMDALYKNLSKAFDKLRCTISLDKTPMDQIFV